MTSMGARQFVDQIVDQDQPSTRQTAGIVRESARRDHPRPTAYTTAGPRCSQPLRATRLEAEASLRVAQPSDPPRFVPHVVPRVLCSLRAGSSDREGPTGGGGSPSAERRRTRKGLAWVANQAAHPHRAGEHAAHGVRAGVGPASPRQAGSSANVLHQHFIGRGPQSA
jgi:hypothetical protein